MKYPFYIFKFGGASIRNALAVRKVADIIRQNRDKKILIVVSAMGKTTNALERAVQSRLSGKDFKVELDSISKFHQEIMTDLFEKSSAVWQKVASEFEKIHLSLTGNLPPAQLYDQVVSRGEVLSSIVVSEFLNAEGMDVVWIDSTQYIITDETYQEGNVDWLATERKIAFLKPLMENNMILTQGFIGGNPLGYTTTLGREGSDYSAAIFGSCMNVESVTIWKDVPGVMNADPKRIPEAVAFKELPFREAAEMTYYGASVIHPKTIKPLANKNIPLLVKNFDDPTLPGTIIRETKVEHLPPLIVFKENQCLVSCRVTDYTFINEQQLSHIFQSLSDLNLKINVMQNSAISFSFCVDYREEPLLLLVERLAAQFEVYYNTGLTLITIKNYDAVTADRYRKKAGVLLEQSSRSTLQVLLRN